MTPYICACGASELFLADPAVPSRCSRCPRCKTSLSARGVAPEERASPEPHVIYLGACIHCRQPLARLMQVPGISPDRIVFAVGVER